MFENIPKNAINHFSTLRRWVKNEQLDLEAILESIERKNGLENLRRKKIKQRQDWLKELNDMN